MGNFGTKDLGMQFVAWSNGIRKARPEQFLVKLLDDGTWFVSLIGQKDTEFSAYDQISSYGLTRGRFWFRSGNEIILYSEQFSGQIAHDDSSDSDVDSGSSSDSDVDSWWTRDSDNSWIMSDSDVDSRRNSDSDSDFDGPLLGDEAYIRNPDGSLRHQGHGPGIAVREGMRQQRIREEEQIMYQKEIGVYSRNWPESWPNVPQGRRAGNIAELQKYFATEQTAPVHIYMAKGRAVPFRRDQGFVFQELNFRFGPRNIVTGLKGSAFQLSWAPSRGGLGDINAVAPNGLKFTLKVLQSNIHRLRSDLYEMLSQHAPSRATFPLVERVRAVNSIQEYISRHRLRGPRFQLSARIFEETISCGVR